MVGSGESGLCAATWGARVKWTREEVEDETTTTTTRDLPLCHTVPHCAFVRC
jgi:hypothetical protein